MQEYLYEIFGLSVGATDSEIDEAYNRLRAKYRSEMFLEGERGDDAAKKLTELEDSYRDVLESRTYKTNEETYSEVGAKFKKVEELVKSGRINEAQDILDDITERTADWHYYQAMVFYKKDWFTDAKKQLELALEKDKDNEKYKKTLQKLEKVMSGGARVEKVDKNNKKNENPAEEWWKEQQKNNGGNSPDWDDNNRQMGGCDDALNCCSQLLCLNLFCNCIGGGC